MSSQFTPPRVPRNPWSLAAVSIVAETMRVGSAADKWTTLEQKQLLCGYPAPKVPGYVQQSIVMSR